MISALLARSALPGAGPEPVPQNSGALMAVLVPSNSDTK